MDAAHVSENTLWKKVKFITEISRKRVRFVQNQYFVQDKHYETKTVFFKHLCLLTLAHYQSFLIIYRFTQG